MDVLKKKGEFPPVGSDNKFINIKSEGLDGVFAELFSLVNLSSIELTNPNNDNPNANEINNKIIDTGGEEIKSDKNSLLAAKSLISIFLNDKEVTSNPDWAEKTSFNLKSFQNTNLPNTENKEKNLKEQNLNFNQKDYLINSVGITNKKKKQSDLTDSHRKYSNFKNSDTTDILVKENKKDNLNNELQKNSNLINKSNQLFSNNVMKNSKKKGLKDKNKIFKISVEYLSKEKSDISIQKIATNKVSKHMLKQTTENKMLLSNNAENFNRGNLVENTVTKNINYNNVHDKQFLDLLESGWGEKFIKSLKQNIENGKNKIDFTIKPKNLGKLKVEVNVEDGKTNIKINAENKTVAHLLNENQMRLNDLLNRDNLRSDSMFQASHQNNSNENSKNNNKNKNDNFDSIQRKIETNSKEGQEISSAKKKLHKVDINA